MFFFLIYYCCISSSNFSDVCDTLFIDIFLCLHVLENLRFLIKSQNWITSQFDAIEFKFVVWKVIKTKRSTIEKKKGSAAFLKFTQNNSFGKKKSMFYHFGPFSFMILHLDPKLHFIYISIL